MAGYEGGQRWLRILIFSGVAFYLWQIYSYQKMAIEMTKNTYDLALSWWFIDLSYVSYRLLEDIIPA